MALIACPECKREISSEALACPGCAHPVAKVTTKSPKRNDKWIIGITCAIGAVLFLGMFGKVEQPSAEDQDQYRLKKQIEVCWKNQERKSLTPDTARLFASVCEGLETDLWQKYGTKP